MSDSGYSMSILKADTRRVSTVGYSDLQARSMRYRISPAGGSPSLPRNCLYASIH
jgi:hypothetical protein